jgi:hypothetical protein
MGVFLSASRSHFMVMVVVIVLAMFSGRLRLVNRIIWIVVLLAIAFLVAGNARLHRFEDLSSADVLTERLAISVNSSFLELIGKYPLGNGLGGGGTSVPYFLQGLIRDPVGLESEYARILLEQGIPGLLLWIGFIGWVLTRRSRLSGSPWHFGRQVGWLTVAAYFATGVIGIGLLTSIPQTGLLLLTTGWITIPGRAKTVVSSRVSIPASPESAALQYEQSA